MLGNQSLLTLSIHLKVCPNWRDTCPLRPLLLLLLLVVVAHTQRAVAVPHLFLRSLRSYVTCSAPAITPAPHGFGPKVFLAETRSNISIANWIWIVRRKLAILATTHVCRASPTETSTGRTDGRRIRHGVKFVRRK